MENKYISPKLEFCVLTNIGTMSLFFSTESDEQKIKTVDFDSWNIK